MTNKRVHLETWGCQMNVHQSEGIAGVLERSGYEMTDSLDDADIVLFNTCAVRQKAEEKVYGRIGAVMERKRDRNVILGFGGCIAQIRGRSLLDRFPAIDFVFGTGDKVALPEVLHAVASQGERIAHLPEPSDTQEIPYRRAGGITAMVTIAEGCSNACAYCIVPRARGALRSRAPHLILDEVAERIEAGTREVLLLGQNVDSYGRDHPEYGDFADLLDRLAVTGIDRIRFTSSHPRDMTQRVIDAIARHGNICKHLHLACQSGSDAVLRAMRRGHTRGEFLEIVQAARRRVPELNVTTDFIVGHPGEQDEDFEGTLDLLETVRFGSVYVAAFSPRPGTASASFPDRVPEAVAQERLRTILERQREIAEEENRRFIGGTVEVLVEGPTRDGRNYGRADDHRTVVLEGGEGLGAIVPVRIERATAASLEGTAAVPAMLKGAT